MFKNTILRPGIANADGNFRKLFPKGRVLIVRVALDGKNTHRLMDLANQAAEKLSSQVSAICTSLAPPRARKDHGEWRDNLASVTCSLLGRGAFDCPIGVAAPARNFDDGFAVAMFSRCHFVYFWDCFSGGPNGPSMHRYQAERGRQRKLIVLSGFSTSLAEDDPLSVCAARSRALADGVVLSGTGQQPPTSHELRIMRETVREFPILLAGPITAQAVRDLPSVEGVFVKIDASCSDRSLQTACRELRQISQALHSH